MAPKRKANAGRRHADLLGAVGERLDDLTRFGYEPTLVGGMALVVLGSPRVTRDVDLLIIEEAREQKEIAAGERRVASDAQDLEFLRR